ncbi:heavy metal translocating P-type ATPase [Roseateles sp. UC29_93]|uniref:heavy metal translocating P-type ATPase n=1 Tax=Roseateles sp. UC29_93 TaxID=3350177 RepID=UPI003672DBF0
MLDWRPALVTLEQLRQSLAPAGYDFVPDVAGPARDLRRREHRQALWRLFVAGFLMMQVMMLAWPSLHRRVRELEPDQAALLRWGQWVLTLPVMLLAAGPFFRAALSQLRGRRLGMDVPVALGLAVAFVAGSGATLDPGGPFGHEVFFDSITMFVTFLLGARYLELRARHRAAAAIEQATEALPEEVERLEPDGTAERVAIEALAVGDRVRVAAGQRVPADAVVEAGNGAADESLLTGEARPVAKAPGDAVLAGSLNLSGVLTLRVRHVGDQTRLAGIRQLMAQAFQDRPAMLRTADRVAGWFLAAVLLLAGVAALGWQFVDPSRTVAVAVSVPIVTCPCALSLAAPAAWVAAAGALARRGLLLSRLDAIEALADVDRIVMDKTGTLTDPHPVCDACGPMLRMPMPMPMPMPILMRRRKPRRRPRCWPQPLIIRCRARWQRRSPSHPRSMTGGRSKSSATGVSKAVTHADIDGGWDRRIGRSRRARYQDRHQDRHQARHRTRSTHRSSWPATVSSAPPGTSMNTCVLARRRRSPDGRPWGATVELLSGDAPARVEAVAKQAGIARWRGGATPEDKHQHVIALQSCGHRVLMIGDGINDAPVLARAQVSIAMGRAPTSRKRAPTRC